MTLAGDRTEYRRNRPRYASYSRGYQQTHKEQLSLYHRSYHRLKKYGLTEEDCRAWLVKQGDACAVCRMPLSIMDRFTIDHDHKCCDSVKTCGKCVRGILCVNCNAGLGNFDDNPDLMLLAIEYLRRV